MTENNPIEILDDDEEIKNNEKKIQLEKDKH